MFEGNGPVRTRNHNRGKYPPHWTRIARRVKRIHGNKCERCKSLNVEGRILTVHHLDGDKSNCALWNLVALCQVCHLQIQAKVCWDQAWLGDHTDWMRWHIERYRRKCRQRGEKAFH